MLGKINLQLALVWHLGTLVSGEFPPFPELIRVGHCAQTVDTGNVVYAEHLPALLLEVQNFGTYKTEDAYLASSQEKPWALSVS